MYKMVFEQRLNNLYRMKIEIQKLEETNKNDKKEFIILRKKIRSQSQKIYQMKEDLIESI